MQYSLTELEQYNTVPPPPQITRAGWWIVRNLTGGIRHKLERMYDTPTGYQVKTVCGRVWMVNEVRPAPRGTHQPCQACTRILEDRHAWTVDE